MKRAGIAFESGGGVEYQEALVVERDVVCATGQTAKGTLCPAPLQARWRSMSYAAQPLLASMSRRARGKTAPFRCEPRAAASRRSSKSAIGRCQQRERAGRRFRTGLIRRIDTRSSVHPEKSPRSARWRACAPTARSSIAVEPHRHDVRPRRQIVFRKHEALAIG